MRLSTGLSLQWEKGFSRRCNTSEREREEKSKERQENEAKLVEITKKRNKKNTINNNNNGRENECFMNVPCWSYIEIRWSCTCVFGPVDTAEWTRIGGFESRSQHTLHDRGQSDELRRKRNVRKKLRSKHVEVRLP